MAIHFGQDFPWENDQYHDPAWKPNYVGTRAPVRDAYEHVTGKAKYSGDISFPNMLHGKILRSTVAHATITNIDTSAAQALAGVRAAVTYQDRADSKTMLGNYNDRYLVNKVRQWGDPVAAVAADTEEIAENALKLIKVTYQELPVILEYADAVKPGAPVINTIWPANQVLAPVTRERGDIQKGFMDADSTFEADYTIGNPTIFPSELCCCIVSYEDGILTVWSRNMGIEAHRNQVSPVVNIPASNIRTIHRHGGSPYSSSHANGWMVPVAALLAIKAGKPVRLEDDIENVTIFGGRAPAQVHLKVGVKKDGTITAIDGTCKDNTGAYGWTSSEMNFTPAATLNLFNCPNERYQISFAATNRSAISQYRGYGAVQGWPIDCMMDEIAEKLGLDTLTLRKKNYPKQWDTVLSFGTWVPQTSTGMVSLVDKLSQTIGWSGKWSAPSTKTGTVKTGLGLGTGSKDSAFSDSNIVARMDPDGSVSVFLDACDIGQAVHTIVPQMMSEILDIPLDKVKPYWGDSAYTPLCGGDYSSRLAMAHGAATRRAAESLVSQLLQKGAAKLSTTVDNLEVKKGAVQLKGKPETAVLYGTLIGSTSCITGTGNNADWPLIRNHFSLNMQYGAACEAQVDTETGGVSFTHWAVGGDVGRAINPSIVEGQLSGSGYSMMGEALMNEIVFDTATGIPLNTSLVDCPWPTAADIPPTDVVMVESIDPWTSFGQKGVGETSMTSQIPTILNTIANATGVRIYQTPATPEVILKALGKI